MKAGEIVTAYTFSTSGALASVTYQTTNLERPISIVRSVAALPPAEQERLEEEIIAAIRERRKARADAKAEAAR